MVRHDQLDHVQAVTHGRWIDQPQNMMETQMVQEAFDEI
jgi:hypothetical protein